MEIFIFILEMIVYAGCFISMFNPNIDLKMMMFFCTTLIAMVIRVTNEKK